MLVFCFLFYMVPGKIHVANHTEINFANLKPNNFELSRFLPSVTYGINILSLFPPS